MTTTVRPRTPAELAVLLPYQLGYHPGPSVVITVLSGRRLGLLQRHDLLADPDDCERAAARALGIVSREGATGLLVIAFEDDEGSSTPLREAMLTAAGSSGVRVQEHLVVRDGRWYAPDCHEACCPEEGLALPRPADVPAVAAFVHAGVAPLRSRDDLVAEVLPDRDEDRAARVGHHLEVLLRLALGRGSIVERGDRLRDTWRTLLDTGPAAARVADLPDSLLARAAWSLADVSWRDALMSALCPGTMGESPDLDLALSAVPGDVTEELHTVRSRLVELSRLVPEEVVPPVLTLVGHLAWWSGDGTVAAIALERALDLDPSYRLAGLMNDLLSSGVRPWSLPGDSDTEAA